MWRGSNFLIIIAITLFTYSYAQSSISNTTLSDATTTVGLVDATTTVNAFATTLITVGNATTLVADVTTTVEAATTTVEAVTTTLTDSTTSLESITAILNSQTTTSISNQIQCINSNDVTCNFFLKNDPTFCTRPGTRIQNMPFNIYCAKSCNNCRTTIAKPTVTKTANKKCVDENSALCNLFDKAHCLAESYIGTEPFQIYCAKFCGFCKATTTSKSPSTVTTTVTNPVTTISNSCSDVNPKLCSTLPKSYCLISSYIGKIPLIEYCQKSCGFCKTTTSIKQKMAKKLPTTQCFDEAKECISNNCKLFDGLSAHPCRFTCNQC